MSEATRMSMIKELAALVLWAVFSLLVFMAMLSTAHASQESDQAHAWAWARHLTGLDGQRPVVIPAGKEFLCERAARGKPCRVMGLYSGGMVYIYHGLDLSDPYGASILVHEYVHHLRRADGKYGCERYMEEERYAYGIQREYLIRQGSLAAVVAGVSMHGATCD